MTFIHIKCISAVQTEKKTHKNENWIQQAYSMKKLTQGLQSE